MTRRHRINWDVFAYRVCMGFCACGGLYLLGHFIEFLLRGGSA